MSTIDIEQIRQHTTKALERTIRAETEQIKRERDLEDKARRQWIAYYRKEIERDIEKLITEASQEGKFTCKWHFRVDNLGHIFELIELIEKKFPGFIFRKLPVSDNGSIGNHEGYGGYPATEWWGDYLISWELPPN